VIASLLDRDFGIALCLGSEAAVRRRDVQWAVELASRYLPGQTTCFPKAVTAHLMCRARGLQTTVYYGATRVADQQLKAHVWLQDGATGVVGHSVAAEYNILAMFPASTSKMRY